MNIFTSRSIARACAFVACSLSIPSVARADAPASPVVFSAEPGKGATIATRDDRFSLTLRGRIQIRDTVTVAPKEDGDGKETTNEINIKTFRLYLQGHVLSPHLKYFTQLAFGGNDFDPGSSTPLFDAFIEYTGLRDLNVRVGQFFVPFDRARTIREFGLQLVDRPDVVRELSLDRDVGVMLSSSDLLGHGGVLSYNAGIFGGEGRNRFGGTKPGFLYVLRLAVRPFGPFDDDVEGDLARLRRPRLMIGVAGAYNQKTDRQRSTTGTILTVAPFDYGHAAADLVFKYAGVSFLGEFLYRKGIDDVHRGVVDGAPKEEWSRSAYGGLLQGGVMVHDKVEVTARWGNLLALGKTDPALVKQIADQGHELAGGANLYLNGHFLKLQSDYTYLFGDVVRRGRHVVRVQVDASF